MVRSNEWRVAYIQALGSKYIIWLLLAGGLWAAVSATGYTDSGAQVYNIEVLPQHTYAVGSAGLLVHNGFTCFKKKYPSLANASDEFFTDFAGDANMLAQFENGTFSYAAWDMLQAYPALRKDAAFLNKAKAVINKGHISAADLKTMVAVNDQLKGRATALADFLDDLDNFAQYKNQSGFNSLVSSLKAGHYNGAGADGANWVISALRKEGTSVFPPGGTVFENQKAGAIYFPTALEGYAAYNGVIYHTTDGADNWQAVHTMPAGDNVISIRGKGGLVYVLGENASGGFILKYKP